MTDHTGTQRVRGYCGLGIARCGARGIAAGDWVSIETPEGRVPPASA